MSVRKYWDQDNYVPDAGVIIQVAPEDDIVERDGYRDTKSIIDEFISAGQRLAEFRREEFDTVEELALHDDNIFVDPTRSPSFDIIDAERLKGALDAKAAKIAAARAELDTKSSAESSDSSAASGEHGAAGT